MRTVCFLVIWVFATPMPPEEEGVQSGDRRVVESGISGVYQENRIKGIKGIDFQTRLWSVPPGAGRSALRGVDVIVLPYGIPLERGSEKWDEGPRKQRDTRLGWRMESGVQI
ncbi:hypothetical protein NPIL_354341 [Nephila pilipes]|uniref:Uncharacterized protein n=1 Tax=Nephila pilipes TaxID=299642 RepID=A0A8X6NIT3_NEPPI|nr:hypothetical protein NPIL_354341 [Nephila pilipes]